MVDKQPESENMQFDDESMFLGLHNSSQEESSATETEVSLLSEGIRPSTTDELVGMLKQAGTQLTVKYITGEISFEDFCLKLEKTKPKTKARASSDVPSTLKVTKASPKHIPAFDKLFKDDEAEADKDDEDEEDMDDDDEEEDDYDDPNECDFIDAGEVSDKRDEDWMPNEFAIKSDKEKGKRGKNKDIDKGKKSKDTGSENKPFRKKRRKLFDLPRHLAGANGKAILLRAQGKTDEAVVLLYDIINKAPKAAAPYQALGSIHEDQGDLQQALKFYMVAANLRGPHATEWVELVEMCIKLNDEKLAMTCFSKALKTAKTNPEKVEILSRKSAYLEQLQLPVKALQCREQMLIFMDRTSCSNILSMARNIANDYIEFKEENGAISVLQYIHKEFPKYIDSEDIHNLAELLMAQKNYTDSLEIIIKHCGVTVHFTGSSSSTDELPTTLQDFLNKKITIESLEFPVLMPVDLKSKLAQCIIFMRALPNLDVIKNLIKSLADTDVENCGDIHYDIAETMVECGYHEEARPVLEGLIHSERYNKAAVWLTYGQCLNALGDLKAAIDAYTQVVEMAPGHYDARVTLSSLLQQMGHNEVALEVLSRGPLEEGRASADQMLLLHKCQLLHSQGKMDEFISAARKLLSFNFPGQCSPEFLKALMYMRTPKHRRSVLPQLTASNRKPNQEKENEAASVNEPSESKESRELKRAEDKKYKENLWEVFMKLCKVLHDRGMMDELVETATLGMTCPVFSYDTQMVKDAEFLCLKMGPLNMSIYYLARNLIIQEKDNNQAWNLYSYIVTQLKEVTDLRFAMRALMKNPNSLALGMLNGNARLISGTYKQALGEYLAVFRQTPDNDMVLLCAALCLVHIACQSYTNNKNILVIQAVCLLHAYKELRGECQETYYNLGRAMNQLDIQYAAVHYYKKALEFPPVVEDKDGTFDLSREIAYNLAQVYMRSNNPDLARYYIEKYCTI